MEWRGGWGWGEWRGLVEWMVKGWKGVSSYIKRDEDTCGVESDGSEGYDREDNAVAWSYWGEQGFWTQSTVGVYYGFDEEKNWSGLNWQMRLMKKMIK